MDDSTDCTRYDLMKISLPQKRVGRGEGELEMEGEQEMRGGMEEGCPDPSSSAVTKPSGCECTFCYTLPNHPRKYTNFLDILASS